MPMDSKDKKKSSENDKEVKIYSGPIKEPPVHKNKNFIASFDFAVWGLKTVFREERNMRKHVVFAILAVIAGIFFGISRYEWLWLMLAVFLVLAMEIINTTFENVVDMVTNFHFHPIGKKIKDMAAAGVLLTAIFALFVGAMIFLPKVWTIFQQLF